MIRVAVTGAAGQIGYSLLFRIANGEMFGKDVPVALHLLEIPEAQKALDGVCMELEDSAFPLLKEVKIGSDPKEVFKGIDWALLVGAKPRGPGMERADLLQENAKIFVAQGEALNEVASKNVKVLVIGNPCNTNSWIAMKQAPNIPKKNFMAMTRLDQNRAMAQLAKKAGASISEVQHTAIWGNHSTTQVPDYFHAKIGGKPALDVIGDASWLEGEFTSLVQKRGGAVIAARGKSSAASAANAIVNTVQSLYTPTKDGDCFSLAVCTDGNPYGIKENLIYSFPCRSNGKGEYEVIGGISIGDALQEKLKATENELVEERNLITQVMV